MTTIRCPGSMSASPSAYDPSISNVPSTSETRKFRGTFSTFVLTNPMGSISMVMSGASCHAARLFASSMVVHHEAVGQLEVMRGEEFGVGEDHIRRAVGRYASAVHDDRAFADLVRVR